MVRESRSTPLIAPWLRLAARSDRTFPGTAVIVILVALVMVILATPPAVSHSLLLNTDPVDGAQVAGIPAEIRFTFNKDVEPQFASVTVSVDGRPAYEVGTRVDGSTVVAEIPPQPVEPGDDTELWEVAYRVVSGDGHPITGDISVTASPSIAEATPDPDGQPSSGLGGSSAPPASAAPPDTVVNDEPLAAARDSRGSTPWPTVLVLALLTLAAASAIVLLAHRRGRITEP
ncbi:MAG: copper resistance CopC family protein [Nocardioidaceae bacterium]